MRLAFEKLLAKVDDCLPAVVVAFDRDANRATVRPLVQMVTTSGEVVPRAALASVPVFQIGAGDCVLNFDLIPGDLGYIKACDRDISLFLQALAEGPPNTKRLHSFSDGVFLPSVIRGQSIAVEDAHNAVFQRRDGSVRLSLWPDFVKITAPRGLHVSDVDGELEDNTLLQVSSTVKASIPWPRMTQAQRDAIPDPQEGMAVWNLDTHGVSTFALGVWS